MSRFNTQLVFPLACLFAICTASFAQEEVDYARDIQPLLAKRCYSCHGPGDVESGLHIDTREGALAEADSGMAAIVPGEPDESELLRRVVSTDEFERMPPEGKPLKSEEIALLRQWISEGAKWKKHWAFEKPEPQTPPEVQHQELVANPIDNFVLKRLETNGLQPNPSADRRTLIRRAYYDLTGLPPTYDEIEAFAADESPQAYENLVDRLLASPQYGERWGRHWLDLVRFAETNSFERDGDKPDAWKYRDYVIRSFNVDKPYDQFLIEQLAGDEIPNPTPESIIATGYYRLGVWDDEPADPLQHEFDHYDDLVNTTGKAMLGLTINCARCHDHKIDPIPQTDYYEMVAFMRDVAPYGKRGDISNSRREITSDDIRKLHDEADERIGRLQGELDEIYRQVVDKLPEGERNEARNPKKRRELEKRIGEFLPEQSKLYEELRQQLREARTEQKQLPQRQFAMAINKALNPPPETHLMMRGNPHVPGDEVKLGFPDIFEAPEPVIIPPAGGKTSGRRLALAKWIASDDNMLTSRVMVNRLWQHHFGRGIVASTDNFGQLGSQPTHPKLLDWLAEQFVASGWSMKQLHKLIMMSNTYQMSSAGSEQALAKDPANNLLWRHDMRRLSAEEIYDSLLVANGSLNDKMFGPSYYPKVSDEVKAGQSQPGAGWHNSSEEERNRRAIYIFVKRSLIPPMLANYDFPETDALCPERFATTQPAQALGMLNGDFLNEQAKEFGDLLRKEAPGDLRQQIVLSIEKGLGRDATEADIQSGEELIAKLKEKHTLSDDRALDLYCLMVLNLNEFIFID
ncbi:PSD1 and planctomycete cytochrome C domain-containing protein [Blastopirellula sp. J2-11]|uniref:PSD1 and planctomycete cytochrome C domain-containing protein n=1 Tax=Blastopirellula sp. J2-11 TaxID=2943192 RepID=UPI0021C964AB|nr:PSD1 and planctomycete cytochrome C domain-containing protein [Blastopirellula sp. J2-11]UUO05113.1 PSD1 and planctomycete cytochrome C domain-containing protein [Blastopirellula sp. J2-11]